MSVWQSAAKSDLPLKARLCSTLDPDPGAFAFVSMERTDTGQTEQYRWKPWGATFLSPPDTKL